MAWYKTGTISLTNGSATVTGLGTEWIANAGIGEAIYAPDGRLYEIASIVSNTSITLASNYLGATSSGQSYVIIPSQSYIRDLASQVATLVNNYGETFSNIGKFPNGTSTSPSISFTEDTDTGFYRSAANELTMVSNGLGIIKYNPTTVSLSTSSNGTSAATEKFKIDNLGRVIFNQGTNWNNDWITVGNTIDTTSTTQGVLGIRGVLPSTATTQRGIFVSPSGADSATPYTTTTANCIQIGYTKGSNQTVTTLSGISITSLTAQATTTYGLNIGASTYNYMQSKLGIGTNTPQANLEISNTTNPSAQFTASISGNTMTVTTMSSGTIAVGQYVFASNVEPNTYITALGTGTGGPGTYTISNSQTVASQTIYSCDGSANNIRITDTDTAVNAGQSIGRLEFYGNDVSTPGSGVKGYINCISESTTPDTSLIFGTTDNVSGSQAVERMRIDSNGQIGVGGLPVSGSLLSITRSTAWSAFANTIGFQNDVTWPSTAITSTISFFDTTQGADSATAYTSTSHYSFRASNYSLGSNQTLTTHYGYYCPALSSATNNYAFYGNVASGTGRYNFYAAGTASNYFAGETTVNSGLTIGRTDVTTPAASDGNVFSGTYTPTLTNTTNVASSTAAACQYMRVGSVVTVSGVVTVIATTANTAFIIGFSLPIASNITAGRQCAGTFGTNTAGGATNCVIYGDSSADVATFRCIPGVNTSQTYYFSFTYQVI